MKYIRQWFSDWYDIFTRELKHIFSDSGVMVIFFLAGLAYPLLYGLIYRNGSVDDMPVAVVDNSGSAASREFVRALDATREVSVAYACADMDQAQRLLQQRDAKGIVMIPSDYEDCLASGRQAHISTYADMSSFLYYKNLTMAASQVMLSEMHDIQTSRFSAAGYSGQQISQLVQPLKYEENMPYNRNFSYSIFFLSAVLLIGCRLLASLHSYRRLRGSSRSENLRTAAELPFRRDFHPAAVLCDRMRGIQLHLQFADTPQGDSVRIVPIHVPYLPVPDRILMAGEQFPGLLEGLLVYLPFDFRGPGLHQHEHRRGLTLDGSSANRRPDHTDNRILFPVLPGRICRKQAATPQGTRFAPASLSLTPHLKTGFFLNFFIQKNLSLEFGKTNFMENRGEVILYQPDNEVKIEVWLEEETVWLTQEQIAILFGTKRPAITKHLNNIYNSGELDRESTCSILEHMGNNGKQKYVTKFYNLDAILSVGYRVNSRNATLFRRWANSVLKEYLLKGYSVNRRLTELEHTVAEHSQKIDFFIRSSLPPVEGIFYDGQIFDAYKFATDLIRSAKKSILLIDNYVDESVLMMLSKRGDGVKADIYTHTISDRLRLDLQKHNFQYPPVELHTYKKSHDRFLIIDDTDIYHIGASMKDLGKKMFAFSKLDIPASAIKYLL